ncbi:MAG: restriction endonuclease, partial [Myxococcales bacterium]|nr:restriction endonuclease [Polyangiaceae bacterium]MDW8249987.1 restriction endonuclease [Myxococcales bacterium]
RRNKKAAGGQRGLDFTRDPGDEEGQAVVREARALETSSDEDAEALARKENRWGALLDSPAFRHQKLVADAWCAAFVWPKQPGELAEVAPTNEVWRQLRDAQGRPAPLLESTVRTLAAQYHFFHWHLQFPQVFARGGFDVVLGNPPWERVKLQEQEFFAPRSQEIAQAPNAAARKKLIEQLPTRDPRLWSDWCAASRKAEGESHFLRQSGRYPLCGKGDVNTYAVFAEHNRTILAPRGRAGFIVPTGIATDDTTKDFFHDLVRNKCLSCIYDFQSGPGLFGDVGHARFKFCLLVIGFESQGIDLCFFARKTEELAESSRRFELNPEDFEILNPNTRTCPTFRSRRDAEINLALYRRAGILWREDDPEGNPWGLRFLAMLHMANDSGLFRTRAELEAAGWRREGNGYLSGEQRAVPLIEAKMVHHFDHRFGDYSDRMEGSLDTQLPDVPVERLQNSNYAPMPRYWVEEHEVSSRLDNRWSHGWLLGWRDICRSTDQRTVIASLIPRVAVGDKFLLMLPDLEAKLVCCLYSCLCSFILDYTARQKVGGTSLKYFTMRQLPVLAPRVYEEEADWHRGITRCAWILPRVVELTYTAWDLEAFGRDVGYEGPPFRWEPGRRFLLRCELDAAFFHLYGISREDAEYILETFPIVRRNDEKDDGEYRTKRVILEIYDGMAEAIRSGEPYRTRLDPPPADPRAAHPESSRPSWARKDRP